MVPPNQRKHAFRRPSAHPNLPKRMVGRFGSLRRLRAFKTRVSDVLRASEPLEICVSDVFHAFEISETRVGDAFGVFCIYGAFNNFCASQNCIQEYSGSNPFSSIKFEALETHFRHLAQACPLILNHVSEMLFGISQAFFRLRKLKDTFGASRALARKLQFWISRC